MAAERFIDKAQLFGEVGYQPHPRQELYHASRARFRVPVCGRRFGKSTMAGKDYEPRLFLPNRFFWIVGPNYDLGEKEFRVIWNDLIVGKRLGKVKEIKRAYAKKQGNMFIEMPWGTRIEVRSAEHPEMLVGEGLDGVIMSEAAKHKEETWERYVRPALTDRRGIADFPTTPEGQNWLYKLWQYGRNPNFPEYESWRFPSWDNPAVYPGGREDPEIQLLERTTSQEWFLQEIGADFTAFVGRIYSEFQEDSHVQTVDFRPDLPNYIFFDWGFVNPLAAIEVQVTPNDEVRIWREHYQAHWTIQEHLEYLRSGRDNPPGYHIEMCFGDAADPEAVQVVSENLAPCYANPAAKTNWRDGVDLVKGFLKEFEHGTDEFGGPLYKPHLIVDHSCTNTIREFNNYKAKAPTGGKNPTQAREAAQNIDDHAMDAIRYGLMHLFRLSAGGSLAEFVDLSRVPTEGLDETEADTFFQLEGAL